MRICHVIEAAGGGSGQVVVDLAKAGLAAGDEVTVVYAPERTEARFLQDLTALPKLKLIPTPMRREVCLRDFLDTLRLYLVLRKAGPFDVIHGHSSKGGALARLAGLLMPRAAKIYTPHAFITMSADASPVYGCLERILSWLCRAVIVVSEQEKEHALHRLKIAQNKLHVILNGIDLDYPTDRAEARQRMGFEDTAYLVGFVGRLVAQKNPRRLIDAFALIAKEAPQARLCIVGEGVLQTEIEEQLEQKGLTARARFFPKINARDLMTGFDCLLCSSDYESFGLIFPEALDAGVPIVTTPVGVAAQAVLDGQTGIVAADFTAESLASGVLELAGLNTAKRTQMTENCHAHARLFGSGAMARATKSLYEQIA